MIRQLFGGASRVIHRQGRLATGSGLRAAVKVFCPARYGDLPEGKLRLGTGNFWKKTVAQASLPVDDARSASVLFGASGGHDWPRVILRMVCPSCPANSRPYSGVRYIIPAILATSPRG